MPRAPKIKDILEYVPGEKFDDAERQRSANVSDGFTEVGFGGGSNPFMVDHDPDADRLSEGVHVAALASIDHKISATGNPMFVCEFEICEDSVYSGFRIRYWCPLTPQTMFKKVELFKALAMPKGESDIRTCVGKLVELTIAHEDYQGEPRPKVAKLKPHEGSVDMTPVGFAVSSGPVPGIKDVTEDIPF